MNKNPLDKAPLLYDIPHRGLRWALARLLTLAGSTDYTDPVSVAALTTALVEVAELTQQHMKHEEEFLHPALTARGSRLGHTLEDEHNEHAQQLKLLVADINGIAESYNPTGRGQDFYLALSRFVGETLSHMDVEERTAQATFEMLYSVEEVVAIHEAIVRAISPTELAAFFRVLLPGLHPDKRFELLAGPKQGMPPELFETVLEASIGYLNKDDRDSLVAWSRS